MLSPTLHRHRAFDGDLDALAEVAGQVLASLGFAETAPTARVVRDYAQRGILSRPERRGKEARYLYRHLVELIAARRLVREGWPLAKIADLFARSGVEELEALAAPPAPQSPALAAIAAIRSRTAGAPNAALKPQLALSIGPDPASGRSARLAELRAELPGLLAALGGPGDLETSSRVELVLAPDLKITISPERLRALSLEDAELIGRAVAAALVSTPSKGAK